MSKPNRKSKTRGQALAEFGLIAPLLLFLILGIADFGRALFTYAMASNALRDAVRYAEVLGPRARDVGRVWAIGGLRRIVRAAGRKERGGEQREEVLSVHACSTDAAAYASPL